MELTYSGQIDYIFHDSKGYQHSARYKIIEEPIEHIMEYLNTLTLKDSLIISTQFIIDHDKTE